MTTHLAGLTDRAAHFVLSLPDAVFVPLAGRRPRIDGQRLSPRLQFLANGAKRGLAATADPATSTQLKLFERLQRATALAQLGDASWRDLAVPGGDGDPRRARLYEPAGLIDGAGLAVFVHGGGWQVGSIEAYDGLCAFLAKTARIKVLSLDYRLSWQAKFPAAFEDVLAGFVDAVDRAEELGITRDRIAIVGDSAGGNLASAVALLLGAERSNRPKLAALIYPAVDHDLDRHKSAHQFDSPLSREIVHRDVRRYATREVDRRDPRFSVMSAPDVSEMPTTYIATAGMDVLRDQGEAFGERLLESGVEADVRRFSNPLMDSSACSSTPGRGPRPQRSRLLIDSGANPKAIQNFMGHSRIQTTFDVYGHLLPGSRDEVRKRMDAYLGGAV